MKGRRSLTNRSASLLHPRPGVAIRATAPILKDSDSSDGKAGARMKAERTSFLSERSIVRAAGSSAVVDELDSTIKRTGLPGFEWPGNCSRSKGTLDLGGIAVLCSIRV